MLIALRFIFYIQLLLGLGRFFGFVANPRIWELHIGLGALIAILALIGLRPHPRLRHDGMRSVARFAPLVVLLTGGMILSGAAFSPSVVILHMVLGIAALGLVERAAAQQRRAGG